MGYVRSTLDYIVLWSGYLTRAGAGGDRLLLLRAALRNRAWSPGAHARPSPNIKIFSTEIKRQIIMTYFILSVANYAYDLRS